MLGAARRLWMANTKSAEGVAEVTRATKLGKE